MAFMKKETFLLYPFTRKYFLSSWEYFSVIYLTYSKIIDYDYKVL